MNQVDRALGAARQGNRILVIDDNPAIHGDIKKILGPSLRDAYGPALDEMSADLFGDDQGPTASRTSFEVDSAYQGQEGLEKVKSRMQTDDPYLLAFVDVRMPPGWDGIETIERLWEADPALQIVLCTAFSDNSWREISGRLHRLDGWLALKKPFDTIEVLQAAHALSNKWLLSQQLHREFASLETMVAGRTQELQVLNEQLMREVGERKVAEENLRHLATHDALTGLANRTLLRDRLEQAIARTRRFKTSLSVLLLDLDGFKGINDSLGHDAGDLVLKAVARRLINCARECDTVARLGGDEFSIVLPDLRTPDDSLVVAERIMTSIREPIALGGQLYDAGASIGIAVFGRDAQEPEGLLKCADVAMYDAKREGKTTGRSVCRFYLPATAAGLSEGNTLRDDLKAAIAGDQLFLMYQPLVDLVTTEIVGFEALVRWRHPTLGVVPPLRFLPLAEEMGLMSAIGRWVLRQVCGQNAEWQRKGLRVVPVAVNLCATELQHPALFDAVSGFLQAAGLSPRLLEIEVTETSMMGDVEQTLTNISRLHDLGVRVVIDDFGVGMSSLNRLKLLPVDAIKIDQIFVREIARDSRDVAIVTAMVSLASSLGLQVVAEGIETQEQLDVLRGLAWGGRESAPGPIGQGYLFSRPVASEDAVRLLAAGHFRRHAVGSGPSR